MTHLLAILFLAFQPVELTAWDRVDLAELNSLYDEQGKLVLRQLVLWDDWGDGYHVRTYRLIKSPEHVPYQTNGRWRVTFSEEGTIRHVEAQTFTESWTQVDVEVVDRERLPKERRAELRTVKKGK